MNTETALTVDSPGLRCSRHPLCFAKKEFQYSMFFDPLYAKRREGGAA